MNRITLHRVFAQRLRAARARAQLTQEEVAEAVGVHVAVYRRWEGRAVHYPSIGKFDKLRAALGCTADELLGFADEPVMPAAVSGEARIVRALQRRLRAATASELAAVTHVLALVGIEENADGNDR